MVKIKLLPLVLGQFFLTLGILYIGVVIKNKIETLIGILVTASIFIVMFFPGILGAAYGWSNIIGMTIYLLSWVYIIIRIILVKLKDITEIGVF